MVKQINYWISRWVSEWHTSPIVGTIILGILLKVFKFLKELPLTQLLAITFIKLILQTEPYEYTEYENLMGPLKGLTDKRPWVNNSLNNMTRNYKIKILKKQMNSHSSSLPQNEPVRRI